MAKPVNLLNLLGVAGGLAAATLPNIARASCSPGAGGFGGGLGGGAAYAAPEPQIDLAAVYTKGLEAYNSGDYRAARRAFNQLVTYMPKQPEVLYLAGTSRMELGDLKGARRLLERAVAAQPDFLVAEQQLGVVYARTSERAKAEGVLARLKARSEQCAAQCQVAEALAASIVAIEAAMAVGAA